MNENYYPFGMEMPARTFSSPLYRYGFNGKEKDDEAKGSGEQYDYGFRIYDPRVGRFLSVDPLFKSYPWYTPYQFAGNKPINSIDLDGLEDKEVTHWITIGLEGKTTIKTSTTDYKDYGGGVGPLGKGTLTNYNVDRRQAVSNPDYGKKGTLAKTLNLPGPIESHSIFAPAPDADKATKKRGGLWFVSKDGSGAGSGSAGELDPGDGEPINIDLLMSVIGGAGLMEPLSTPEDIEGIKKVPESIKRIVSILENIGKISEAGEAGAEIKDGINDYLKKRAKELPDPNTVHCIACNENVLVKDGKATWDKSENIPSDTIKSHSDTLKNNQNTSADKTQPKKKG